MEELIRDITGEDYDIKGYHKKRTITLGELRRVEYYLNYDGTTYSNLMVDETRDYTRDANALVISRLQTSKWYDGQGTLQFEKTFTKYYTPQEAIEESATRNGNVLSDCKLYILSQVGLEYGQDMMLSVGTEMNVYINGYRVPLINAIQASTKPYMTQVIKDTACAILNY
jgi:hypothetical protein